MNKKYNSVLEGVIYTIHKANLDEDSGKRYVLLATNYLSKRLVVKYTPYVYELEQIKEYYPNEYKNYILPFETYLINHQEE